MTMSSPPERSLPHALPSRYSFYSVTITDVISLCGLPLSIVACPIYIILYRTSLYLSLPCPLPHLRLPPRIPTIRLVSANSVVAVAAAAAATARPKPPDQRGPPRPRRRPLHLVQGPHQAGLAPLALVLVEPALTG